MKITLQTADFDLSAELAELRAKDRDIGAIVSFVGTVRDGQIPLKTLTLEHYPGMTEKSLEHIVQQAYQRWNIKDVTVIHRVGELSVGDQIVLVAVASQHRGEAFNACEFVMDYLKTDAPFWKKEMGEQGEQWVEARDSDARAMQKWTNGLST